MDRLLSTPELLLTIFSFADKGTLLASARVCQTWSPQALDYLWRDLDSVVPLLQLICPTAQSGSHGSWTVEDKTAQKLIHFMLQRPINLKSFSFGSSIPPEQISHYLVQLISKSPQLESITLPRYYQTQIIVDSLGHLRKLKSLRVRHKWNQSQDPRGQALSFPPGRFPELNAVEIDAPIPEITRILMEFRPAIKLRDLTISCAHLNNEVHTAALIALVAQCRPELLPVHSGIHREHDFEEMAQAWPNLQVLTLGPESERQGAGGLSWNMIPIMANPFPNLEQLSSYFSSIDKVSFAGDILPQAEFRSLKKLEVGMSATPKDHTALGFFIGAHCQPLISISCEASVWEGRWRKNSDAVKWQDVENVARRVHQAKLEMRKRWRFSGNGEDN
ncbi:hypothetical protein M407DRAFT_4540 [Tulasnella calospora MUT 4182]|uniref:F-box domain-containing protein n=1 Tax=Tulasnella calospora MUT 4182 TaxID=1051891 RepID=A0A0C3LEM0_9AGAM|nr:hypothetical protein M407DRAFT_4540 [Tulasnella calospora MUT 4182]